MVRPYALTSGRTRSSVDLPVEAIIEQTDSGRERDWNGQSQLGTIVAACASRTSVAEISAAAKLPLGVVRVLLGDLVEQGHVRIAATTLTDASSRDVRQDLIERTLRGLRAI
ncbi:hypothetical protein N802_01465 [Knoellia sinensis KCTC 19936]|uniref:DUF742 domain-containing protein n=1 Tax=Knoellia sinensis KCTC 19936 TaxID=1385520 RepID=A0A0A0JFB0_9MICO|nr:hypothetical protein N802_01465 [Knoellia sinensis KCTC 19936]